jgi:regulator of replication initiation timing
MVKVILILVLIPGLLGFLVSNTINMHGDLQQLQAENQKLSHELSQMRSHYGAMVQERDVLLAENANLRYQFDAIQTAYLTENQARLQAEADLETYKGMVLNLSNNAQTASAPACVPAGQQARMPGELLLSALAPVSLSSLFTLAIVGLIAAMINHSRKQKKLRSLPPQIRKLR